MEISRMDLSISTAAQFLGLNSKQRLIYNGASLCIISDPDDYIEPSETMHDIQVLAIASMESAMELMNIQSRLKKHHHIEAKLFNRGGLMHLMI